jgi:hypothetical protein
MAIRLNVFGKHMLVERTGDEWRTYLLGADGKRSPADVAIPATVAESELAQYFDDLFHEAASPRHPVVVRVEDSE